MPSSNPSRRDHGGEFLALNGALRGNPAQPRSVQTSLWHWVDGGITLPYCQREEGLGLILLLFIIRARAGWGVQPPAADHVQGSPALGTDPALLLHGLQ